jgi:hypothetical protein
VQEFRQQKACKAPRWKRKAREAISGTENSRRKLDATNQHAPAARLVHLMSSSPYTAVHHRFKRLQYQIPHNTKPIKGLQRRRRRSFHAKGEPPLLQVGAVQTGQHIQFRKEQPFGPTGLNTARSLVTFSDTISRSAHGMITRFNASLRAEGSPSLVHGCLLHLNASSSTGAAQHST